MSSLLWFRRDLRIRDHPALAAALADGDVLPVFVTDPYFDRAGDPRRALLADCLRELYEATDGALVIRSGDPVDEIPALAAEINARTVFVSREYTPYGRRRDSAVGDALRGAGRRLIGEGSPYAVQPGSVRKDDGEPYSVFTPFSRRWAGHRVDDPIDAPRSPNWITADSDPLPERPAIEFASSSEANVQARWRTFRDGALGDYADQRDFPSLDGTSHLSPWIKYGVVHPRQLLAELDLSDEHHRVFTSELIWRDFYADVLFHHPDSAWNHLHRKFDAIEYDTDAAAQERFGRWRAGETGFPIVDAGMRQLLATGWMHNRVRMIVASFLVKDLHLPWTWGARHFLQHLLDGDLASNNHGWQWAAGSGTDAAPYFRVFNPTSQLDRWDADRTYVRRWVDNYDADSYPAPMVDHGAERREALDRYEAVKSAG